MVLNFSEPAVVKLISRIVGMYMFTAYSKWFKLVFLEKQMAMVIIHYRYNMDILLNIENRPSGN
jgi:hypothetical protein